jgi:hypothetical protein
MSLSDRERAEGFRGCPASPSTSSEHHREERAEGFRGGRVYVSNANKLDRREEK